MGELNASLTEQKRAQTLAHVWGMSVGHSSSFGLKAIVKLRIPDILAEANKPMTLQEITEKLGGTNIQVDPLRRLMDFMAVQEIFDVEDGGERLYKMNDNTRMCTMDNFGGLLQAQDEIITGGWHRIPEYILNGGKLPFERAHGKQLWQLMAENEDFKINFDKVMAAMSNQIITSVLQHYHGFKEIKGTLVDVGGSLGTDLQRIIATNPDIKGINLELPFLANTAPSIPGVMHVAGDMFEDIPQANAVMIKGVLHSFSDERALVALQNCYKALPSGGKVIIVDIVMDPQGGAFDKLKFAFDCVVLAFSEGGRERNLAQWTELLTGSGFERITLVHIPQCLQAVVEAYKP